MADPITDYTTLKTAISSYLWDRQDIIDQIPVFVGLCEAQLNRRLRMRRMMTRATATIDAEFVMLPSDFAGSQAIYLDGSPPVKLAYAANPESIVEMKSLRSSVSGKPEAYTVVGNQFEFCPAPDDTYTGNLVYYRRIPSLSDSVPTNWLVQDHPDAYLFGSLLQTAPWLREDERLVTWGNLYTQIIQDMTQSDQREVSAPDLRMPDRLDIS